MGDRSKGRSKMQTNEETTGQGRAVLFRAVACKACGAEWANGDPAIRVACSECQAGPGEPCRWTRPTSYGFHIRRDALAMREGHLSACEALTWDGRHSRYAIDVLEPAPLGPL